MSEEKIYEQLRDWLKQTWYAIPEAAELLPLLKATYTPEEASLLTGMPFRGMNLEELAEMKQMEPEELRQRLDSMAEKGQVFRTVRSDTVRYSLNDAFFVDYRSAFWPGRTDERSKAIAPLANQYYYHGIWDQWDHTRYKGLRTLPVQGTIEDTREIRPYEEVLKVLDQHDYFTVSICPCKHRKNMDPDFADCDFPTEVCPILVGSVTTSWKTAWVEKSTGRKLKKFSVKVLKPDWSMVYQTCRKPLIPSAIVTLAAV